MKRYKKRDFGVLKRFCDKIFPNRRDNVKQIALKISYLAVILAMICATIGFGTYYGDVYMEKRLLNTERKIYSENDTKTATELLKQRNSDYVGWITLPNTELNCPIYKHTDNSFYLNMNSQKKSSKYGSLFLDCEMDINKSNRVIYGNNAQDGMMFSTLEKLRTLKYYKENYRFKFSDGGSEEEYVIYAVFVINSKREQDDGKIYNIRMNDFADAARVDDWVDDAKERSVIDTNIGATKFDKVITLVTICDDFDDARLVVMARAIREGETLSITNDRATPNPTPKYPKKWYTDRNIEYPF